MKNIKPLAELLPSLKNIEGFPIGKDEDILKLSDPPYYTACPNPYINDFIEEHGTPYNEETDDYHCDPFVGDVSEGKNDPIYNAHSYHTKVPHKAIMKYIEHYTKVGDLVFDGFCGTGMTGVAAQLLGRKAILSDLSPIATFIAYNYNKKVDVAEFEKEAKRILKEVEDECGWMYETNHTENATKNKAEQTDIFGKSEAHAKKGKINYTVWSDVFICPYCGREIVFYEVAVDKENGSVRDEFNCAHCQAKMKKRDCKRAEITLFDKAIGKEITQSKQIPVLINYTFNKKSFEKQPDASDLALIEKIENSDIPYWFPTNRMMEGDEARRNDRTGITHVHHFYTKRNLWVLSCFYCRIMNTKDELIKNTLLYTYTGSITGLSKQQRYRHKSGFPNMILSGTLYIGSQTREWNAIQWFTGKLKGTITKFLPALNWIIKKTAAIISTNSLSTISLTQNKIDYIFTDPPFGDNLMYSELNFIWEAWLKVITNNKSEAIMNNSQNKGLSEYAELMTKAFKEYYRVLKPNRWITVEFHNSKSSVWNAIQDGMIKAGFIIANVAVLDKKQGSFKQVTSPGAVKNDLVISAYKPKQKFETKFREKAGEGLEEEFIKMHLGHLPAEPSIERTEQMLYSKLLAYYVQRSYTVKYDAQQFYKMLRTSFVDIDGFWFLREQISNYEEYKKKMKLDGIDAIANKLQALFVNDEKSALIWLFSFLNQPKDLQTIHPAFTKVSTISGDRVPELRELLEDNFIKEDDLYRRPASEAEKSTISQKRERELLREFEALLLEAKGTGKKKIKECRKQAVVYGFEYCYKKERFADILILAKKLDAQILESDSEINEFIEVAEIKMEGF